MSHTPTGQVWERHIKEFLTKFVMAKRVESPSSINTFKQCKRKYYYNYIEKLPTLSNIHCVRGNIAHSTLEDFYDVDISTFNEDNYPEKFKGVIQKLLLHQWNKYGPKLKEVNLTKDQEKFYFEETMLMLMNWTNHFLTDMTKLMKKKNIPLVEAFQQLTPIREQEYKSDNYSVRGFIDAIHHLEDEIHIVDYKTNARFNFKDSIKLQLAIYSLLYQEKHGKTPHKLCIFFLRHKLKFIDFDPELLELAKRELELIHAHTSITEAVQDYPRTVTPLCKWSTGQCDFYETCSPHKK
jgi:RecB family exonuclease